MSNLAEETSTPRSEDAVHTLRQETQAQKRCCRSPRGQGSDDGGGDLGGELEEGEHRRSYYFQSNGWWFASTAFPLIAGTFGPLANLLSICALVQTWRVDPRSRDDLHPERVPDPAWLLPVNSLSLVAAITANLSLLLNFARRIRYAFAQPLTITLWYLSSSLLLSIVIAAAKTLQDPVYEFSQSFYYGILAAGLYFIIATLLLINLYGCTFAKQYPASFNSLTMPQRTLMLQTIVLMFYIALGALLFSKVEGWEYVDAVYWADYTLLTVGFGSDFPLQTDLAKGLLIPFAVSGIIVVGLVVDSVRDLVLERAKKKVAQRAVEKERRKWLGEWAGDVGGKREFHAMRRVQQRALRHQNWSSLCISMLALLVLWFGGAAVFMSCEREAGWGYFASLYFAYTTLLTLGYGDYIPSATPSKPVFVVWSLIAVPTMTILISNMGSTIISNFRHLTLFLASNTILPEPRNRSANSQGEPKSTHAQAPDPENIADSIQAVEEKCGKRRLLLAEITREIIVLAGHLGEKPQRRYAFEEWKRYLALLGEEREWSWLGESGPLLSGASETEWLLERLCRRLEEGLREVGG